VLPIAEAKQAGAIAFFGEKYGDSVRVRDMGESKEFCGGTHVARTGDIAFFLITEETASPRGAPHRGGHGRGRARLRAPAGGRDRRDRAPAARGRLRDRGARRKLQSELRERDNEIDKLKRKLASGGGRDLASEARDVGGVRVLATRADVADAKALREVADQLRDKLRSAVIVLAGVEGDKIALVAMVTSDLTAASTPARSSARWRPPWAARAAGAPTWRRRAARSPSTWTPRWRGSSISFVAERGTAFMIGGEDVGGTVAAACAPAPAGQELGGRSAACAPLAR
jgi:alanyl-tRNA synthetase